MKTITTADNQTIYDIAVQHYGTVDAVGEILALNPEIVNDPKGYNIDTADFYFDLPVKAGSVLNIDDQSDLMDKIKAKEITDAVTCFAAWEE